MIAVYKYRVAEENALYLEFIFMRVAMGTT